MPSTLLDVAKRGRLKECVRLLNGGADIEGRGLSQTPLEGAVVMGHVDVVRLLIERGADFNQTCSGVHRPLLTVAAANGDVEICRLLIERGLSVNAIDDRSYAALHLAAYEGRPEVVRLLIENGARVDLVDRDYKSALHHAIFGVKDVDSCRVLFQYGLRPSIVPAGAPLDYLTPLQHAMALDREEIVAFFIEECGESIEQVALDGRSTELLVKSSPKVAACLHALRTAAAVDAAIDVKATALNDAARSVGFGPL